MVINQNLLISSQKIILDTLSINDLDLFKKANITLSYLRKRSRIQLSKGKDFFLIDEEINKFEKIQWAFPNSLRLRCLINYHNGLKNRGYKLSND